MDNRFEWSLWKIRKIASFASDSESGDSVASEHEGLHEKNKVLEENQSSDKDILRPKPVNALIISHTMPKVKSNKRKLTKI